MIWWLPGLAYWCAGIWCLSAVCGFVDGFGQYGMICTGCCWRFRVVLLVFCGLWFGGFLV